ncbi:MAG: [protein-PII] uridylyltransferase [Planctomycetota bacterium]|nr:[protein-PII] uridylyltransferase [Planctomycetota bacterium]
MPTGLRLRPSVLVAREKLADGRAKLRAQHEAGSPGIQVCAKLTDLLDTVLLELYHDALDDVGRDIESLIALAPYGGYGRRDVAPYSDVDLMLLHKPGTEHRIAPFVRRLTQDIVDAGLDLGYSRRTPAYACSLAQSDATIFTALVESRYLAGSVCLFSRFMHKFRKMALRRSRSLIAKIEASRQTERNQHGDTIYLLKPNVKRSRGGLRDLQMVRWIGFARWGEAEPSSLALAGHLAAADRSKLRDAREFLLRLRNELHFHAGKSLDLLDRHEQVRIAELYGYEGDENQLPVERFMRDYIEHTSHVRYCAAHFVETAKARRSIAKFVGELFSRRVEGDFRVGPVHIWATRQGKEKLRADLSEVLRLMDWANRTKTRIDHETWQMIRESMLEPSSVQLSPQAIARFRSLLDQPGELGDLLRRLHELRVLEKLVPPLAHARHLMQFNEYHRYTVDEHSIRAIECASEFQDRDDSLGRAYRKINKKWLLHLALLLHDLGKGFSEDHSEVGQRLAGETAGFLGLGESDTEILKFLVHKHLVMSHLAQWRDTNDDNVVVQFAVDVGSAEVLRMLYVLTCADLAAVGPGVLNRWKLDLLTQLYRRARAHLAGDINPEDEDRWLTERRETLNRLAELEADPAWWHQQIAEIPRSYLMDYEPPDMMERLAGLAVLPRDRAVAWGRWLEDRKAIEFTVGAYEDITAGIFHRLTGALTSSGLEILSAEIHTLADGLILDRFHVSDLRHSGEPPQERLDEVGRNLEASLSVASSDSPSFRRTWARQTTASPETGRLPTRVRIDNDTSDQYTILDIFTHDRTGLLYAISRAIFELGLSVHGAKIGTHLDQVVDVFYVTDATGGKVEDEIRTGEIRARLLREIESPTMCD